MSSIYGWYRELNDDRLELFLKVEGVAGTPDTKLRASGSQRHIYELVDWFEERTGMRVEGQMSTWRRPRRGPKPMDGQTSLLLDEFPAEVTP